MTIKEIIEQLQTVENKDLKLYIDTGNTDMYEIDFITLFDDDDSHSEENMFSVGSRTLNDMHDNGESVWRN